VTDRGATQFVLKAEEDIRRLLGAMLIITDSHGLRFYVTDMQQLDKHSRRILDRFL
jgi:spore germination protein YaaH